MKRSRSIRLVLMGGLSAGALAGCNPDQGAKTSLSPDCVYANNYYVPGVGYYHAPFRAWYALPYNHFDAQRQQFYFGGQWAAAPHQTITNLSSPAVEVVQQAQAMRTDVQRGGFGSSWVFFGGHS